jgi:hypothetical protein
VKCWPREPQPNFFLLWSQLHFLPSHKQRRKGGYSPKEQQQLTSEIQVMDCLVDFQQLWEVLHTLVSKVIVCTHAPKRVRKNSFQELQLHPKSRHFSVVFTERNSKIVFAPSSPILFPSK